jgi:hypothetical protein
VPTKTFAIHPPYGLTRRELAAITIPDNDNTPNATAIFVCAAIDPISGGAINRPA